MGEVRYMISDAADKLGMEAHVLRYWEEELELEVPRNEMGHRYYTQEWLNVFDQIRLLKKKGYQLRAIKMLIHNQNQCDAGEFVIDLDQEWLGFSEVMEPVGDAKMEQFQELMTNIVKKALAENVLQLGQAVSEQVGEKVIKEMNYLMREREEQEEARFRKLDETLRNHQKKMKKERKRRFWKGSKEVVPEVSLRPQEET